ncbi:cation diffusion facilitator family transporter [Caldithrix abyssi]
MGNVNFKERATIARRVTWVGIIWNLVLIAIKFVAGFLAHSSALIADAFHSVSDFGSDIAVLISVRLSNRPVDDTHHYGHGKIETLASIIITVFLFFVAIGILIKGSLKIIDFYKGVPLDHPGLAAFLAAILSIIVKEGLYQYTLKKGQQIKSSALIANAWHHRTDAFTSIAVSVGIGGAYFLGKQYLIMDPIAAILVSVFILNYVRTSFQEGINELLEASLGQEMTDQIIEISKQVNGVYVPHNLKTRRIGNTIAIDMHIKVKPTLSVVEAHQIASDLENALKKEFGEDSFISIHVEPYYQEGHLK